MTMSTLQELLDLGLRRDLNIITDGIQSYN